MSFKSKTIRKVIIGGLDHVLYDDLHVAPFSVKRMASARAAKIKVLEPMAFSTEKEAIEFFKGNKK